MAKINFDKFRREWKPLTLKPKVEYSKLNTCFVVESKKLQELGFAVSRIHAFFGSGKAHALEVTATAKIPELPASEKMYVLDIKRPVTYLDAMSLFTENRDALARAWLMTGAQRIINEEGSWNSEISFSPDRISLNGIVIGSESVDKSIQFARSILLPYLKAAKFDALFAQWGLYLDRPLPGTIEFKSTHGAYRTEGGPVTLTATGFIRTSEIDKYLLDLFSKHADSIEEVMIYGSLIHGFVRDISVRRRPEKDGYTLTVVMDSLGGGLKQRVEEGYLKALSGS